MASRLKPLSCKSIDGDIVSDKADILNRQKEYIQNLYDMTEDKLEMP
jgi:vacuolar-type H+-ATPase subunit E/Vma4